MEGGARASGLRRRAGAPPGAPPGAPAPGPPGPEAGAGGAGKSPRREESEAAVRLAGQFLGLRTLRRGLGKGWLLW